MIGGSSPRRRGLIEGILWWRYLHVLTCFAVRSNATILYLYVLCLFGVVAMFCSGPAVKQMFSCSTQLSKKFQLLIKTKISTNEEVACFKFLRCLFLSC